MNLNDIRNVRSRKDYDAALVELVNDFHDREGTPDDERPDVQAELERVFRKPRTGEEAVRRGSPPRGLTTKDNGSRQQR